MESLEIVPLAGAARATVRPPGSKSITNRALVCAALARGRSTLTGALVSEDVEVMLASLKELGVAIEAFDDGTTLIVDGCDGAWPARKAELFVANSGTTMRFLTAAAALGHGRFRLDGVPRMRQRPIGDLVAALRSLGVEARCEGANDCPPVTIHAAGLAGGSVEIAGDISSQFLSGLMLVAPYARQDMDILLAGKLVSVPYVAMTQQLMEAFGGKVTKPGPSNAVLREMMRVLADQLTADANWRQNRVACDRRYIGREYAIEPDASAASYFFAAAAVTAGAVTVNGLTRHSLQGDMAFCDCLERMGAQVEYSDDATTVRGGALRGIEVDMNAISDTASTLAVVALFADGPTAIRNIAHVRHKETDRIAATACELRKLGAQVEELPDGFIVHPKQLHGATIDTYDDHRMAMSFAVAGLRIPGVIIRNPRCTEKTYPKFFEDFEKLRT